MTNLADKIIDPSMHDYSRRTFMLLSLGFLAGCAGEMTTSSLPGTPWEKNRNTDRIARSRGADGSYEPWIRGDLNRPDRSTPTQPSISTSDLPQGVIPRNAWATGNPIPTRMDPLTDIYRATVHHDGMSPFWSASEASSRARIDAIRKAHQNAGWGDIGYHYIVDRAGRVYEGRPLRYQGAHVKYNNPGNIGIMCLGNFDEQNPTEAQVAALQQHLRLVMRLHRLDTPHVFTHQELRPTACPGVSLQRFMVNVRHNGLLA